MHIDHEMIMIPSTLVLAMYPRCRDWNGYMKMHALDTYTIFSSTAAIINLNDFYTGLNFKF